VIPAKKNRNYPILDLDGNFMVEERILAKEPPIKSQGGLTIGTKDKISLKPRQLISHRLIVYAVASKPYWE